MRFLLHSSRNLMHCGAITFSMRFWSRACVATRPCRRFAERQLGLVTRTQLLCAGLTAGAIRVRVARATMYREHRGVYRVGHRAPLPFSREMAAVLAAGSRTVVSDGSAGYLWALLPAPADYVELTGPPRAPRPGFRMHQRSPRTFRGHTLPRDSRHDRGQDDLRSRRGNRVDELERVVAEAERRGLIRLRQLVAALERHPRRHGAPALRALLGRDTAPAFTRSEAERRLLALIRAAGLPAPEHNVRVHGSEVDMLWREQGLVVEVDGFAFHSAREAFERDRMRDARLTRAGLRVMRVTWRRLAGAPQAVVADLAQALAGPSRPRPLRGPAGGRGRVGRPR